MGVFKLTEQNKEKVLKEAERVLKSGYIIIGPTDTVCGIFADARNEKAIKKIFELKQRPEEKALSIFVKDIAMARQYAYISDKKSKFLEKVWPGAVTVVFQHKEKLPKILTGGLDTIGIRIPNYPFMLELLSRLDFPLVQTSANISGKSPVKSPQAVEEQFNPMTPGVIGLIIDGGELSATASTVIDFTRDEPLILRSGLVTKRELDRIV